ncbi:MAG TPA: hypothetical protein VM370_13030 [Candidatus Thermoplasmatota archaeon]|nr:hypothetical protein [Candidatus Thermoplasmatota archaeon]
MALPPAGVTSTFESQVRPPSDVAATWMPVGIGVDVPTRPIGRGNVTSVEK